VPKDFPGPRCRCRISAGRSTPRGARDRCWWP
jgi:hypothetical protein